MHKNPLPPVVIHQSQPKATLDVIDFEELSISQEKNITQAAEAREGTRVSKHSKYSCIEIPSPTRLAAWHLFCVFCLSFYFDQRKQYFDT